MRVLLDTHVLIWMFETPAKIKKPTEDLIKDRANVVFVSAVSAWEIALKVRLGKLQFDANFLANFDVNVRGLSFVPIPIVSAQMIAGAGIPGSHNDPFDRLLAGQALVEQLSVVTADPAFKNLGVPIVW